MKTRTDMDEIRDIAKKYRIEVEEYAGNIIVAKTIYGSWRFDITEKPYWLFHRPICLWNYRESIKYNDGYHKQDKSFTDFEDLFNYIYRHDIKSHKHPGPKKSLPPRKKKFGSKKSNLKQDFHGKKRNKT